jgi:hypothetical protein
MVLLGWSLINIISSGIPANMFLLVPVFSIFVVSSFVWATYVVWRDSGEHIVDFLKTPFSNISFYFLPFLSIITFWHSRTGKTNRVSLFKPLLLMMCGSVFFAVGIYIFKPRNPFWVWQYVFQTTIIFFCCTIISLFAAANLMSLIKSGFPKNSLVQNWFWILTSFLVLVGDTWVFSH